MEKEQVSILLNKNEKERLRELLIRVVGDSIHCAYCLESFIPKGHLQNEAWRLYKELFKEDMKMQETPENSIKNAAIEAEQMRWQQAIYTLIIKETGDDRIDGAGCDSCDPLDVTLAEISQGFALCKATVLEKEKKIFRINFTRVKESKNAFLVAMIPALPLPTTLVTSEIVTGIAVIAANDVDGGGVYSYVHLEADEKEFIGDTMVGACIPMNTWVWCELFTN